MSNSTANVVSLTFDHDNRYAPDVRLGAQVDLVLTEKLGAGQTVRIAFGDGYLNLNRLSTFSDGAKSTTLSLPGNRIATIDYVVSDEGRHISFFASYKIIGEIDAITATARHSAEPDVAVVTTVDVDTLDESDSQLFGVHRIDNFDVVDSRGRTESLLDTSTTQLALVDFGALWCGPTTAFLITFDKLQAKLGTSIDMKSVLFEDGSRAYADAAEAAVIEGVYRLPGQVFTVSAEDPVQAAVRKDLGLTGFSPQALIDQATGEVLGFVESDQGTIEGYVDDIAADVQAILSSLSGIAATPGIVRIGTAASDVLAGSVRADRLEGGAGRDYLDGGYGNDLLIGGAGRDVLVGGVGDDVLRGGDDNDRLVAGPGHDRLIGDAGDGDVADYQAYATGIYGRLADGVSHGGYVKADGVVVGRFHGIEQLWGSNHDDVLIGSDRGDTLYGGPGDDQIRSGGNTTSAGRDVIAGDSGSDRIWLEGGVADVDGGIGEDEIHILGGFALIDDQDSDADTIDFSALGFGIELTANFFGTMSYRMAIAQEGDIVFTGQITQIDRVIGTDHADTMYGDDNGAVLFGGGGADVLIGVGGVNELYGGAGTDRLIAGDGGDILLGESGSDVLVGGAGDDLIAGGAGSDTLTGGAGADSFVWDSGHFFGRDTITDFSQRDGDVIDLTNLGPLSFIGSGAFDGAGQGEVRLRDVGATTYIQVDVNGDRHADMSIALTGLHVLTASDFALAPTGDLPG